jgi:hypothetical protein
MSRKQTNKSNGYSKRKFFSFPKNGTIPASFTVPTSTDTNPFICWSPTLKKYYFADSASSGKIYSQSPDGNKTLIHTCSGTVYGIHWSKTLSLLVAMTSTHIYTSANGTAWISQTVPASYAPSDSMSTFVDATSYLLVFGIETSTGYMYKTTNGIDWVRSASGTGSSTTVVAGSIGNTVGYSENTGSGSDTASYTTDGTTYSTAAGGPASSVDWFFPPTPIRPEFWLGYAANNPYQSSVDGITYVVKDAAPVNAGGLTAGNPAWFGGVMRAYSTSAAMMEFMSNSATSPNGISSTGTYPAETLVSIEGEYATYTNRTKAHRVGTWLDIGDHEVWLIGGGAPNANTSVGGTAGCMVIHRLSVNEKWRYCVYVYLGAAAIVDVQTGEFLAYASMLTSSSTSAQVNTAGFGSETYPGLGSAGSWGAACGPSNGSAAFLGPNTAALGSMSTATTAATTPPDFWTPFDFAGNPSGTAYPGTGGNTLAKIGFMGSSTGTTVIGSFGSGGCNTSTALATVGGEPLAIIYSN